MKEPILVFGSGGQAKVTIDILELRGSIKIAGMIDNTSESKGFMGYKILGGDDELSQLGLKSGVLAIGDNYIRSKVANKILSIIPDFKFVNAIHPSAQICNNVEIGEGSMIMAGVCINSSAIIGSHCIINTNATIDHDDNIGNFVSLNPGVSLGGKVTIGAYSSIGLGSSVIHELSVGEHAIVGAGSVVVKDIPSNVIAYGNPCRVVRHHDIA
jgi:sugar O-acyltransferase (sialic acid O-acetyltransferase NeuD family)